MLIIFIIFSIDRHQRWYPIERGNFPFESDVDQYYSYLPAAFIHHDLSFSFPNNYWGTTLENGNTIPKVTMGMAIMYSPFFFIGRTFAGSEKNNAYSQTYKMTIHFGTFIYVLLALWFLRKNLLHFFNEYITTITIICVFFGTNLFYYTFNLGEMPHAYLFFVFSLFIYFVLKWDKTKKVQYYYGFSFLAGFAALIRPTESIILLFPLLLGVNSLSGLKEKISLFISNKIELSIAFILFILPFFFQMIYWKIYANQYLFFSYTNERFYFLDPQIGNFLFSFRKGWLLYTPMMIFAVLGIFFLKKVAKDLFIFSILYLIINIYILSSWWDWAFGGSFGCRALIQHYAFFALGFAAFLKITLNFFNNLLLKYCLQIFICSLFYLIIQLNLNQSLLYRYNLIHCSGMTKEAYLYIFNKDGVLPKEIDKKIKEPNMKDMLNGKRDY